MYVPVDAFEATLTASSMDCFRTCLKKADRFSLALNGPRVTSEPGSRVRAKIAAELETLMPIAVREMYAANIWLGTAMRASLIMLAHLDGAARARLETEPEPFISLGRWEDLALYSGSRILLWTCTHEREGNVYGKASELQAWHLDPRPVRAQKIAASPLSGDAQAKIMGLVTSVESPAR